MTDEEVYNSRWFAEVPRWQWLLAVVPGGPGRRRYRAAVERAAEQQAVRHGTTPVGSAVSAVVSRGWRGVTVQAWVMAVGPYLPDVEEGPPAPEEVIP